MNNTPQTPEPASDGESVRPFALQIRVYYEDTDFGGIVYYANYLKFMERARTEYLRSLGFNQGVLMEKEQRMFVVKSAEIKFVSPARFDDVLDVTAEVKNVRRASMLFSQQCRVAESATGKPGDLLASADVLIACLDADSFKPCSVPEPLKMVLDH